MGRTTAASRAGCGTPRTTAAAICEPLCLASHPCQEGQGACTEDSGCADNHFFACSTNCLNPFLMSEESYHRNLLSLTTSSQCCVRRCHGGHQCSHGQVSCDLGLSARPLLRHQWGPTPGQRKGLGLLSGLFCLQGICKYKCSSEEHCEEGEGPCRGDDNACSNSGFYGCSQYTCINSDIFPPSLHPNNTWQHYEWFDHCCTRRCHHSHHLCSY